MNRQEKRRNWFWFAAALFWVVLVIVGYYIYHRPLNQQIAVSLAAAAADVITAAAATCLAGAVGRVLFHPDSLQTGEKVVLQAALGYGLLAFTWLGVGLLGWFRNWTAWLLLLGGLGVFRKSALAWIRDVRFAVSTISPAGFWQCFLSSSILVMVGMQLIQALAPAVSWDAQMYHLAIPDQYLSAGKFFFQPDNFYWGQPQLVELLFTWGMGLLRQQTATVLSWFLFVLLMFGIYFSFRKISETGAWLALAALLVGMTFRFSASSGYVDAISVLFGYGIWVCLSADLENDHPQNMLWAGVFTGFALWVKITNGVMLPVLAVSVLMVHNWKKEILWRGGAAVLIALGVFLPWLIILWSFTGNPLYPHFWEAGQVSAARYSFFHNPGQSPGWTALWLPLSMTWFGLDEVYISGKLIYATDVGPLLLGLGGIGLLGNWKEPRVKLAGLWLGVGWVIILAAGLWSAIFWQTRLFFILLPAAAYLVAESWPLLKNIRLPRIRFHRVAAGLIMLVIILTLLQDLTRWTRTDLPGVVLGTVSEESYLDRNLPGYHQALRAVRDLPPDSRVIFLWEPRGFYAPENTSPDVWIDRWYLTAREFAAGEEIQNLWRAQGITHLLINYNGLIHERQSRDEYRESDWLMLDQLLEELPPPAVFQGQYGLYSLVD